MCPRADDYFPLGLYGVWPPMGMYGRLRSCTPAELESLRRPQEDEDGPDEEDDIGVSSMASLDLDKSWHAVGYLIEGTLEASDSPLGWAVYGRHRVNAFDEDPRHFLEPAEVIAVAEALESLDLAAAAKRYDPARFDELDIYPGYWARDDAVANWGQTLAGLLERVRDFYRAAAANRRCVVAEQS